ncbi:hypothetical protein DY000_02033097 [Brassica cretica]|uniref:Aspartic peptidase DDI1-type domain-containing protein n=1 Tax=Brassica cretica TaxID=69181 RepID=A0ABQ7DWP3_BRACR|nr:hypothetical protein DY000_02033097 [Brassica cretica]
MIQESLQLSTVEPSTNLTTQNRSTLIQLHRSTLNLNNDAESVHQQTLEEDRVSTGRTLRRRKEKVAKHLKSGANEKEKENFQKRIFRIPLHRPFEEAYYTHRLWMFFRDTREKEEDIRRMFCEDREKMRMRITLKKKSDLGQFGVPCTVKRIEFPHALCDTGASVSILPRVMADHLDLQIGNALVPVDFHVLDIKLNWNSSLLLGRAFLSTVGAVCNLQTNQLCLTLIDPNAHYDPIPVKKPQTNSRRINDPGIIGACQCGAEYEYDYSESINTHLVTSIDTQPQQRCRKRASTDTAYYKSVDTDFNRVRDGDYSIGSWADEHHHESFAVETTTYTPGADKLQDSFTDEELLNMQKRDDTDQIQAEAPIDRHSSSTIDRHQQYHVDRQPDPDSYAKAIDGRTLHVSGEDIADILQTANGADNLFMHQRSNPEQKTTKEFYDTAGGIENNFKQRSRHTTHPSIDVDVATSVDRQSEFGRRAYDLYGNRKFYWEEKGEYGVYRDDKEFARELDGRTIPFHNKDMRRLLERASRDEPAYMSS